MRRISRWAGGWICGWITVGAFFSLQLAAQPLAPAPRLVEVSFRPEMPKQGESVRAFVRLLTSFQSPDEVRTEVHATIDGASVPLLASASDLWTTTLGPFSIPGRHELRVRISLEEKRRADELRAAITQLNQEVLRLEDEIRHEKDPIRKDELRSLRAARVSIRKHLQSEIQTTREVIGTDVFEFEVEPVLDEDQARTLISVLQNHHLLIQNNDGGWEWIEGLGGKSTENPNDGSYPNQFGLHGQAILDAHAVTGEGLNLLSARRASDHLMAISVGRTQRIFPNDVEFLATASDRFGFSNLRGQAEAGHRAEKDFAATLHVLNHPNPPAADVNAVPQEQVDAVSISERLSAYRRRLIEWGGRNAGLRAFDWYARVRSSLLVGDIAYARAIAGIVASDASSIDPDANHGLTGLANTILALSAFVTEEPSFAPTLAETRTRLLVRQRGDGLFTAGSLAVNLQDQAFILQALARIGEIEPMQRLMGALQARQSAAGAMLGFGPECVECQSELLSALREVWERHVKPMDLTSEMRLQTGEENSVFENSSIATPFL